MSIERQRALEARAMILSPRVGSWEGRYKIPQEIVKLTIGGDQLSGADAKERGLTTPQITLLNDNWPLDAQGVPWRRRFRQLRSLKDRILKKYSIPFDAISARIIPMLRAADFFHEFIGLTLGALQEQQAQASGEEAERLDARLTAVQLANPLAGEETPVYDPSREEQSFAYQWAEAADDFIREWVSVMAQIRDNARPREALEAIEDRIPSSRRRMRAKFYCHVLPVELAGSADRPERITDDALRAYESVTRASCQRAVDEAIEALIARPREELAAAISGLQDVISRDGRVSTKSFRPVYEALEKLRAFQFAADDEIVASIDELQSRLDNTRPASLSPTTADTSGFSAALQRTVGEVENAAAQDRAIQAFGRPLRNLRMG